MSEEQVNTGGIHGFKYTSEDIQRIESEDTDSTAAFKKGLKLERGFRTNNDQYKPIKTFHLSDGDNLQASLDQDSEHSKKWIWIIVGVLAIAGFIIILQQI